MRLFGKKQETPPPKPKRRKKRLPKAMRRDEISAVLDANREIRDNERAARWRRDQAVRDDALLLVMYRAGLRVGEAVKLELEDVEVDDGIIHVWDGKGGDGTAYFDPAVLGPALRAWLSVRTTYARAGEKRLFVTTRSPAGDPVTVRYVQRMVKRLAERAGVSPEKITPHRLRHSYATELLEEGFDLRMVQEAVRHANVATTQIYTSVRNDRLRKAIQKRGGGEDE